jgi:hypothetical protein
MVGIVVLNGGEYVECQECGAYEFYEVARLHVFQDGAKKLLCRGCMPISCVVSK